MTTNILCICDYGQIRSVGMKCYINGLQRTNGRIEKLKYDVLAVGSVTSSKKTMKMLKQWADIIIDMRKYIEDKYPHSWDDDLQNECAKIWENIRIGDNSDNSQQLASRNNGVGNEPIMEETPEMLSNSPADTSKIGDNSEVKK